jgi:hypothetical protein
MVLMTSMTSHLLRLTMATLKERSISVPTSSVCLTSTPVSSFYRTTQARGPHEHQNSQFYHNVFSLFACNCPQFAPTRAQEVAGHSREAGTTGSGIQIETLPLIEAGMVVK